jgi:hypothetical protein
MSQLTDVVIYRRKREVDGQIWKYLLHIPILFSFFMTYHRICNQSSTAFSEHLSSPSVYFCGIHVAQSLVFCVVVCSILYPLVATLYLRKSKIWNAISTERYTGTSKTGAVRMYVVVLIVFSELRWAVIVRFVDTGGIDSI